MKYIIAIFSLTLLMPFMVQAEANYDYDNMTQEFTTSDGDGDELNLEEQSGSNFYYGYPMHYRAFRYPFMYSHYALPYRGLLYGYGGLYSSYGLFGRLYGSSRILRFPYYRNYYLSNYLYPLTTYGYNMPVTKTVVKINKADDNKE